MGLQHKDKYTVYDLVDRFECRSETWESLPPLPTARGNCAAVTLDGYVYVVGGLRNANEDTCGNLECYDPADCIDGKWEGLTPMPTRRMSCAAGVLAGDKLYVAGGEGDNTDELDAFEVFEIL